MHGQATDPTVTMMPERRALDKERIDYCRRFGAGSINSAGLTFSALASRASTLMVMLRLPRSTAEM